MRQRAAEMGAHLPFRLPAPTIIELRRKLMSMLVWICFCCSCPSSSSWICSLSRSAIQPEMTCSTTLIAITTSFTVSSASCTVHACNPSASSSASCASWVSSCVQMSDCFDCSRKLELMLEVEEAIPQTTSTKYSSSTPRSSCFAPKMPNSALTKPMTAYVRSRDMETVSVCIAEVTIVAMKSTNSITASTISTFEIPLAEPFRTATTHGAPHGNGQGKRERKSLVRFSALRGEARTGQLGLALEHRALLEGQPLVPLPRRLERERRHRAPRPCVRGHGLGGSGRHSSGAGRLTAPPWWLCLCHGAVVCAR